MTKWRRSTKREALNSVPVYFTLAMLIGLPVDALFDGAPDYEGSFFRAVYFAVAMPVASLILKMRTVDIANYVSGTRH